MRYYLYVQDRVIGPYDAEGVKQAAVAYGTGMATLATRGGSEEWRPLGELEELRDSAGPPPLPRLERVRSRDVLFGIFALGVFVVWGMYEWDQAFEKSQKEGAVSAVSPEEALYAKLEAKVFGIYWANGDSTRISNFQMFDGVNPGEKMLWFNVVRDGVKERDVVVFDDRWEKALRHRFNWPH